MSRVANPTPPSPLPEESGRGSLLRVNARLHHGRLANGVQSAMRFVNYRPADEGYGIKL